MGARLDVQTRDSVLQLTIDNPEQRNALMPEISRAAAEALRLAAPDPAVRGHRRVSGETHCRVSKTKVTGNS